MRLLNNKLIGVPQENSEHSGLIHIPVTAKQQGVAVPVKVMFVGSKFPHKDHVKEGDIVYASKYFGDELHHIRFGISNCRVYSGDDILAVKE